jgi:hypothetical protein
VAAARTAGPPDALSRSLSLASIAATMSGDGASARRLLDEARTIAGGLDDLGATLMDDGAGPVTSVRFTRGAGGVEVEPDPARTRVLKARADVEISWLASSPW